MRLTTYLGLVLGALAVGGPADAGCGPTPATQPARSYCIECTFMKIGPGGKEKCLARPVLMVLDGQHAEFISGGEKAVESADGAGQAVYVPFGCSLRARIRGLDPKKVRIDATVETSELEQARPDGIRLQGKSVRAIETVKLGEVLKLVQKGGDGKPQHRVELKITEVPRVDTTSQPKSCGASACVSGRGNLAYGASWVLRLASARPGPISSEAATMRPAPRSAPLPAQATATYGPPQPIAQAVPAPVAAYVPAPAVTTAPPPPPAVPHANDVRAEPVEGHPGLIRLTTLIHSLARDGSAAPPIPFVQYVCVPTSAQQLQRLARKGSERAGTAAVEHKLDRILDRLEQVEKRLTDAEKPASAPADKGQGTAEPTGCYPSTGGALINLDFGFPVNNTKPADPQQVFQFWSSFCR